MTVIKGFFFDLDGTLVNTHESNVGAYKDAISHITGNSFEREGDLRGLIMNGESSKEFLPKLIMNITDAQLDAINSRKKDVYPNYLAESSLNDFLVNFLSSIKKNHLTALVTTAKKDNANAVLKHYGIEDFFDYKIYGDDVLSMKPNPEAYMKALELTGLASDEVIAFEDSMKGIEAASSAGIKVVEIKEFLK